MYKRQLQANVLAPILGIDDPRTSDRIDFVGGIRGLGELERRCSGEMALAFSLYPVTKLCIRDSLWRYSHDSCAVM